MGQRLNIELVHNDKTIANCYYHWSAYTNCACELTKIILDNYNRPPNSEALTDDGWLLLAVRLLESTGAGIYTEDIPTFEEKFKDMTFKAGLDRNDGLISITEANIENTRNWEEGSVTIDLDNLLVSFDVINWLGETDAEELEYMEIVPEELETIDVDPKGIPFDEFHSFAEKVCSVDAFKDADGEMWSTIC